jgi:regulatory protein
VPVRLVQIARYSLRRAAIIVSGALRGKAIRLLARRDRSRRLLDPSGAQAEDVSALLDELQAQGWLSEARLAEQVINVRRPRMSAAYLRQEMRRRGVQADVIAQATAGLETSDLPTALALWQRRFGTPAADRAERARQLRFLLTRGFSSGLALEVLRIAAAGETPEADS